MGHYRITTQGDTMNIQFPQVHKATDYHDFDVKAQALRSFGVPVNVREIDHSGSAYWAIFFVGSLTKEELNDAVNKAQTDRTLGTVRGIFKS